MNDASPRRARHYLGFGPYRLYPAERELFRGSEPIDLTPKATEALLLLIERRGHVVEKEELLRKLWPDTFVAEANLAQQIAHLRKALGDVLDEKPCIETVPRRGYRFAAPVTDSWEGEETRPTVDRPALRRLESRARTVWLTAALTTGVVAAMMATWRLSGPPDRQLVLTQLTTETGLAHQPSISPDGKFVAYSSDRGGEGRLDICVQQLPRGKPIRLTGEDGNSYEPSFSPDGSQIAFVSDRAGAYLNGSGIYVIPALGGEAIRIVDQGRRPRFSPDGKWIAYWVGARHSAGSVYVVPSGGGAPREVIPPHLRSGSSHSRSPIWTPDGEHLLIRRSPITEGADWWVVPVEGGDATRTGAFEVLSAAGLQGADTPVPVPEAWIPGTGDVVFSARLGDSINLWTIRISTQNWRAEGKPRRLTVGPGPDSQASVSSDRRLVFSSVKPNLDIWSLPLEANSGKVAGQIRQLTRGTARDSAPSVSADGTRLVFLSDRTGKRVVWAMDLGTGEQRALTDAPSDGPVLSQDGTKVVYAGASQSTVDLFLLPFAGGVPKKICEGWGYPFDWTPDGEKILYCALRPKPPHLRWVRPATGEQGVALQHPRSEIWKGFLSPDGRWIAFGVQPKGQFIAPFRAGAAAPEAEWVPTHGLRWAPDGNRMYGVFGDDGFRCIWSQRLDPATKRALGKPEPAFHSHDPRRALSNIASPDEIGLSVARDKLVFALGELSGNIWMAAQQ